jgi:hypothetical protein
MIHITGNHDHRFLRTVGDQALRGVRHPGANQRLSIRELALNWPHVARGHWGFLCFAGPRNARLSSPSRFRVLAPRASMPLRKSVLENEHRCSLSIEDRTARRLGGNYRLPGAARHLEVRLQRPGSLGAALGFLAYAAVDRRSAAKVHNHNERRTGDGTG